MKWAFYILLISIMITPLLGQSDNSNLSIAVNTPVKDDWMLQVKKSGKDLQVKMIKERFFTELVISMHETDSINPLLIINGINISPAEDLNADERKAFHDYFQSDIVENILILDENPERLHRSKNISGIILITLTDKKASRLVKKFR